MINKALQLHANREYQEVENGIKTCMYPGYPELFMQLNKKNEFHFEPYWYKGIEYTKEQERGYDSNEDLYVPGYFEVNIKKGESIIFSAGISEASTNDMTVNNIRTPTEFLYCFNYTAGIKYSSAVIIIIFISIFISSL